MAKKIPQINASSMADISFLLLIFFLVTTSMDVNQGLARRLPPPPQAEQEKAEQDINQRNLLIVKINSRNQITYRDGSMEKGDLKEIDINDLKGVAMEFILNPEAKLHLPVVTEEDASTPTGTVRVRYCKDHIISVQNDVDTQYQAYLEVQDALVAAYNEVRKKMSFDLFHKSFDDLDENQQKLIKDYYPQKISEAEPKNYN
jgi:biopolymer transport protein ExbD